MIVLAGTRKGLFLLESDEGRRDWQVEGPLVPGWEIYHAVLDPRDDVLYACSNTFAYGANVHRSRDRGQTWEHAEQLGLPEDGELKLEKTWHVEPGRDSDLWLGGAPGALFRSGDGGVEWELVTGLFDHSSRERWQPGGGGMCCHSIQISPDGAIYAGISAAGAFRSEDDGETWTPVNKGTAADFMPDDPFPEVGQCVHKLLVHPEQPSRLWQQNHCGVYRSDDRGDNWERLEANGLPSGFGFPLALHPRDPDVAYVVPEEGAENRVTSDGRLGVYKTTDGGASWALAANGLPDPAWLAVLREGMAFDRLDPAGVYVGTQSGSVFVSPDEGGVWITAAENLPPVLSIEVGEWQS
jgi:Sortilin, neurotensin receptor 3,